MLIDKEMFDKVEEFLCKKGKTVKFESEYGEIKGRMMITKADIPDGIDVRLIPGKTPQAFEASFDFYDSIVGLAIYTDTKEVATEIWVIEQRDGATTPDYVWIEFFIEKLIESINEDGSYGVPVYSFVNDNCDMTIVPTKQVTI